MSTVYAEDRRVDAKIRIRTAATDDAQAIRDIYSYYVEHTSITFEYEVPTVMEFQNRIAHTLEHYPYLVAEIEGEIIGYAYAGQFHPRAAYGWNVEMTIYLQHGIQRQGVGRKLYTVLENILKKQGFIKAIAIITLPVDEYSNYNSMQFHERMGYHLAGQLDSCGYKFNRWYSVIWMDKMLGTPTENMSKVRKFDDVKEKFI